jgi:hypothetical protein
MLEVNGIVPVVGVRLQVTKVVAPGLPGELCEQLLTLPMVVVQRLL